MKSEDKEDAPVLLPPYIFNEVKDASLKRDHSNNPLVEIISAINHLNDFAVIHSDQGEISNDKRWAPPYRATFITFSIRDTINEEGKVFDIIKEWEDFYRVKNKPNELYDIQKKMTIQFPQFVFTKCNVPDGTYFQAFVIMIRTYWTSEPSVALDLFDILAKNIRSYSLNR